MEMRWTRIELAMVLTVEFAVVQKPPIAPARLPPVMFCNAPKPVVHEKRNTWRHWITASSVGGSETPPRATSPPFPSRENFLVPSTNALDFTSSCNGGLSSKTSMRGFFVSTEVGRVSTFGVGRICQREVIKRAEKL